jgi:hypothetical protein
LIYVPEKIGDSHLVVFDQHFMSGITGTRKVFEQGKMERNVGKIGGGKAEITETTSNITNLMGLGSKRNFQK